MTVRAVSIQPGSMSAEDFRLGLSVFLTPKDVLNSFSGFVPGCVPTISLAGGLGITVPKFRGVVQGSSASNQGIYGVINDGNVTVTLDAGGTNDRIDLIVAQIRNTAYDSSGFNDVRLTFVKGTEAASPVAPTLPVSTIKLGQIRVQAGASASNPLVAGNLTAVSGPVIAGVGGIRPVSSLLGGLSDNGLYPGQYRDNNGVLERWDGNFWVDSQSDNNDAVSALMTAALSFGATVGSATVPKNFDCGGSSASTASDGTVLVTHALGATPDVVLAVMTESANSPYYCRVKTRSSTSFSVQVRNAAAAGDVAAGGQPGNFFWIAINT